MIRHDDKSMELILSEIAPIADGLYNHGCDLWLAEV
jgi:hypothetical protein